MEASTTGNSYQWYENGTKINGATNKTYTVNSVTANAKYECKITTNGGSKTTNFLKSTNGKDYGDFEFPASQATSWDQYKESFEVDDQIRNEKYYARIELKKFMQDGVCDAGESTTTKNPNLIKPAWFNSTSAYQNNYMLAVDGPQANAGAFEFFEVYDLKLKAGQEYEFSCYIINIDKKYTPGGSRSLPQLQFKLVQGGNVLKSGNLFTIDPSLTKWGKYDVTYTASQNLDGVKLIISNQTQGQDGNDFAIDAVYFGAKQNSASTTTTDVFNLTVYDTFTYKFETTPVCPGAEATITTTLVPVHNGTLDPNITKEWIKYSDRSFASDKQNLVVTAPNAVGSVTYELTSKGQYCGNLSQTTSITVKDCGREVPINHPAVTYCTNQNVTLKCDKTGSSVKWDHDASLTNTEITVVSNSAVNKEDTYKCTITTTENGNTVTYIETFTVKTRDCSVLVEPTMCNTITESTLTTSKVGDSYLWKLPDGSTKSTTTNTLTITHTNTNVGDKFSYSCEIRENSMLIATELFDVTIIDCHVETDDEEELQVKEDGSIKLLVPEENRCNGCSYNWYKKKEDGTKGEAVVKNAGEEDWEHTVYNAVEDEYICEIIAPNGNKHVQSYTVKVYTPKTSEYCYTANTDEQKEIITLTQGDKDEYEWYWMKGNQEIPFPEGSISTENNIITLNEDYFVQNGNANYPIIVHILEKYSHKLEIKSNDTQKEENSTDILPDTEDTEDTGNTGNTNTDPINPVPGPGPTISPAPTVSTKSFGVNINSSKLSKDTPRSNDSTFTYNYQIVDNTSGETIDVADVFVVNPKCKYNETFPAKSAGMSSHDCNVRLTDKGINGCTAYKGDDPNNKYFIEVDGGDTAGPVFSIKQPGKLIKGKKYLLTFLVRETSTTSGNPPTTNPAKIDFKITINGQRYGITNEITITNQEWERREFNYIALDDEEKVIITVSNFTTSSGHNDFAIDDITFTLQEDIASRNALALRNATAFNNDEVVDEDGDGYVMWRAEHIHYIYPETTQTIVESSSPNLEFEKEITLPSGDQINFRYDPSIYDGVMTQYQDSTYKEDEHGCKHYAYFTLNLIEIKPDLFFSPNGDGVHDRWMVEGIETAPNAHIMIYDRHSKLLYKGKGSDFQGWDGNYNNHGMVQDDYWYVILVPETNETISGHFILKR
jgi:gliding motility-associated-like protein